jgi:hypothetical protein
VYNTWFQVTWKSDSQSNSKKRKFENGSSKLKLLIFDLLVQQIVDARMPQRCLSQAGVIELS